MNSLKRLIITIILLALITPSGFAQESPETSSGYPGKTGIGLYGSAAHFLWGDRDDSMISPWFGIAVSHMFNQNVGLELYTGLGYDRPRDTDVSGFSGYITPRPDTPYMTYVAPVTLNMNLHMTPNQGVSPYVSFGTGFLAWELRNTNTSNIVSGTNLNLLANFGLGTEFYFAEGFSFDLSFRYHYLVNQQQDMSGLGDVNTANIEAKAGVNWYFGGEEDSDNDGIPDHRDDCPADPEDSDGFQDGDGCPDIDNDGDGIADKMDECPGQAEDLDGYEDSDGCPDPDNDGDGIPDKNDECPTQAEDKDGVKDSDGCPDVDNDGDGIDDRNDECPGKAEDIDGYQDEDGCPDPDNDGDGILDKNDECPGSAETQNGYQDQDGCPDEKPGKQIEIRKAEPVILEGVNFEFDSAKLQTNSKRILDLVVETLQTKPDMTVQINGHTDSIGSEQYNRNLSKRRADSVKEYLVNQGIDEGRIETRGFGESKPIAPNDTADGREKNRRIEIIRME